MTWFLTVWPTESHVLVSLPENTGTFFVCYAAEISQTNILIEMIKFEDRHKSKGKRDMEMNTVTLLP